MIVERLFTTCIDTADTEVMYSADITSALKRLLANMYVGKNFKRCHIIEILEIVRQSPIILESQRTTGSARVTVGFRVKAVVYDRYEVIPAARIVEIMEDGKIYLKGEYTSIVLMPNAKLQQFRKDQTVPVRVASCRYIPYKTSVTVTAIPFVPLTQAVTGAAPAQWDVAIQAGEAKTLGDLRARLDAAYKDLDDAFTGDKKTADAWMRFVDPSGGDAHVRPPAGFRAQNVMDVTGSVTIYRPDWMPLAARDKFETVFVKERTDTRATKASGVNLLAMYIQSMIKDVTTVAALAREYGKPDDSVAWQRLYRAEALSR